MDMNQKSNVVVMKRSDSSFVHTVLITGLLLISMMLVVTQAIADTRTQAKRMHDRLAGVPPTMAKLNEMVALLPGDPVAAALLAIDNKNFYNVTLKNFITPWTNEAQTVFPLDSGTEGTLNDYTATVIGIIRDDRDFREILFENVLYTGKSTLGLPNYSNVNNAHYKALEERVGLDLRVDLVPAGEAVQSTIYASISPTPFILPAASTAGILTSRAAAKAFFVDGTNRAMFRFTMLNHLCNDMEQVKDVTLVPDRIRQDVSRSPGGDSRIFMNGCIGCHTGMDPLTQAFAYYDYEYPLDGNMDPIYEDGKLVFNDVGDIDINKDGEQTTFVKEGITVATRVQEKFLINPDNFKYGYITTSDDWENYWRTGKNALLGWNPTPLASSTGKGTGAKSMGQELAYSDAFARCQVEKVFKTVCLHPALNQTDRNQITNTLIPSFKSSGYHLKQVFAETAAYCMGN